MRYVTLSVLAVTLAGCGDLRPQFNDRPGLFEGLERPRLFDRFGGNRASAPILPRQPQPQPQTEALGTGPDGEVLASVLPPEPGTEAPATPAASGALGTTIAALGDPTEAGFWLKTGLVTAATQGRVVYGKTGRSVNVELRPSGGPPGAGSQISLAAMRLLDASITELIEVNVFGN